MSPHGWDIIEANCQHGTNTLSMVSYHVILVLGGDVDTNDYSRVLTQQ